MLCPRASCSLCYKVGAATQGCFGIEEMEAEGVLDKIEWLEEGLRMTPLRLEVSSGHRLGYASMGVVPCCMLL